MVRTSAPIDTVPFTDIVAEFIEAVGKDPSYAVAIIRKAKAIEHKRNSWSHRLQYRAYTGQFKEPFGWQVIDLVSWLESHMKSAELVCGHSWLYKEVPPDGEVYCNKCGKYRLPLDAPKPARTGRGGNHLPKDVRAQMVAEAKALSAQYNAKEIATKLGFSKTTIARWIKE